MYILFVIFWSWPTTIIFSGLAQVYNWVLKNGEHAKCCGAWYSVKCNYPHWMSTAFNFTEYIINSYSVTRCISYYAACAWCAIVRCTIGRNAFTRDTIGGWCIHIIAHRSAVVWCFEIITTSFNIKSYAAACAYGIGIVDNVDVVYLAWLCVFFTLQTHGNS